MRRFVVFILALSLLSSVSLPEAFALAEFKKAFETKYVDKVKNKEFAAVVKKAGCNVCHVKGQKEKSPQNAYGKELNKLIEGSANERKKEAGSDAAKKAAVKEALLKEIEEAFKKTESMKLPDSEQTILECIEAGKIPVPLPDGAATDDDSKDDE